MNQLVRVDRRRDRAVAAHSSTAPQVLCRGSEAGQRVIAAYASGVYAFGGHVVMP